MKSDDLKWVGQWMSVVGMELSIQHDVSDRCFCFLLDRLILRVILLSILIQRRQGIRTTEEIFYVYILYGSFIEFHVVSAQYVRKFRVDQKFLKIMISRRKIMTSRRGRYK